MLVGLQPIVTVLARARVARRARRGRQWIGLALGLAGVALVVRHKLGFSGDLAGLVPALVALAGISVGTLYQKRHARPRGPARRRRDPVTRCARSPFAAARAVRRVDADPLDAVVRFALAWSVLVLSVGAISLLYVLLRHGAAANVAALFFLVPPVTALMAWLLFGETLDAARSAAWC